MTKVERTAEDAFVPGTQLGTQIYYLYWGQVARQAFGGQWRRVGSGVGGFHQQAEMVLWAGVAHHAVLHAYQAVAPLLGTHVGF